MELAQELLGMACLGPRGVVGNNVFHKVPEGLIRRDIRMCGLMNSVARYCMANFPALEAVANVEDVVIWMMELATPLVASMSANPVPANVRGSGRHGGRGLDARAARWTCQ